MDLKRPAPLKKPLRMKDMCFANLKINIFFHKQRDMHVCNSTYRFKYKKRRIRRRRKVREE
jgi:hypothetical protein